MFPHLLCFQPLFVIWGKQKGSCSYLLFPSWLWQVVLAMCAFATFQRGVLKNCTLKHGVCGVAKSCVCKKKNSMMLRRNNMKQHDKLRTCDFWNFRMITMNPCPTNPKNFIQNVSLHGMRKRGFQSSMIH